MQSPGFDVTRPNVARIYNYLLGSKDNFAVDRRAGDQLLEVIPESRVVARQNREFLGRVVTYLVRDAGIRQIIDLGSGLPDLNNVHQVAHLIAPETRVVYVDFDPVVIAHGLALLANRDDNVAFVHGDVRTPHMILNHSEVTELVDFTQPVAVMMIAIMHFVGNHERPLEIIGQFQERMTYGSYLALSHITDEEVTTEKSKAAQEVYADATAHVYPRSFGQIKEFFEGMDIIPPGLADVSAWRNPAYRSGHYRRLAYGGVARKGA